MPVRIFRYCANCSAVMFHMCWPYPYCNAELISCSAIGFLELLTTHADCNPCDASEPSRENQHIIPSQVLRQRNACEQSQEDEHRGHRCQSRVYDKTPAQKSARSLSGVAQCFTAVVSRSFRQKLVSHLKAEAQHHVVSPCLRLSES